MPFCLTLLRAVMTVCAMSMAGVRVAGVQCVTARVVGPAGVMSGVGAGVSAEAGEGHDEEAGAAEDQREKEWIHLCKYYVHRAGTGGFRA